MGLSWKGRVPYSTALGVGLDQGRELRAEAALQGKPGETSRVGLLGLNSQLSGKTGLEEASKCLHFVLCVNTCVRSVGCVGLLLTRSGRLLCQAR